MAVLPNLPSWSSLLSPWWTGCEPPLSSLGQDWYCKLKCCQVSWCSKAVEQTPHDREVIGLNRDRCWAFSFSSLSYQVLNHVPQGGVTPLIFLLK